MEILEAFVINNKEYNINILWKDDEALFRATEIANILEINNIHTSILNFDDDEKILCNIITNSGNKESIFLTENGIYRLLMQSRKPIAKSFQKWLCKVIKTIRKTGKYELELKIQESENKFKLALEEEAKKMKEIVELNKHTSLVDAFRNKYIVYIAKIKDIDDKILIKIGSSKEIQNRVLTLIKDYKTFNLIKIYECPRNEAFEKFLHHHPNISKYKYNGLEYNSYELFLVSDVELKKVIEIATHNKFKFSSTLDNQEIIEVENLKLLQIQEKNKQIELLNNNANDNTYIDPIILLNDNRKHTQQRGNKIQRYSADGKTLIKTYESYAYALRDSSLSSSMSISRLSIKNAIDKKLIYKNYRWMELKRELDDNTFQDIGETVQSKIAKIGYVAMLNLDKTEIVKVFPDQKACKEDRQLTSSASVANAIKRESICRGHYIKMWDDCNEELKQKYLENNKLPNKRVNGISIHQLHPINNNILKVYSSVEDVMKEFKIARKTLLSSCNFDIICKGYKWKIADK